MPGQTGAGGEVPDWVFKRTPAELKAAMQAAQRKRQQDEVSTALHQQHFFLTVYDQDCLSLCIPYALSPY